MNTLLLQYAVEVEKTGSISKAASNLYMEQPNLSKAIKSLEENFGTKIFERSSKGVVPTVKGTVFLEYAKTILSQIDEMESLYKPGKQQPNELKVSAPKNSYIGYAFSFFVNQLMRLDGMRLDFLEHPASETINDVANNNCSIGIICYPSLFRNYFLQALADRHMTYETIREYEYQLLCSKAHPLADSTELLYHELTAGYTEVVGSDPDLPAIVPKAIKKTIPLKYPRNRICVTGQDNQFTLLAMNPDSYMWTPPLPAPMLERYGLIQKNCTMANRTYQDVLIYLKSHTLSSLEQAFLNVVYQIRDEISINK